MANVNIIKDIVNDILFINNIVNITFISSVIRVIVDAIFFLFTFF